ncbi:STAS domain-containing protein [Streptomyces pactum]|uniref:STAS domain-containing protein n=1 Tax=Streptomyces pactum TaxID=68249 RepID=UPI003703303F
MPWSETPVPALMGDASGTPSEGTAGPALREDGVPQYAWGGAWVIVARGAYDLDTVAPLADALKTAAGEHPKVVLDASGVTFADSTFLNLLLVTHHTGTLRLAAPSAPVRRLCEITGVDGVLQIRDTVEDAALS